MISLTPTPIKTEITALDMAGFFTPPNLPVKLALPSTLRLLAELTLIEAIPGFTGEIAPQKTKGLLSDLIKYADRDARGLPQLSDTDAHKTIEIVRQFGENSGWLDQKKDMATMLSFAAAMIENSPNDFNPKIIKTISELILHFEDGKKLSQACLWGGELAAERWEKLFEADEN